MSDNELNGQAEAAEHGLVAVQEDGAATSGALRAKKSAPLQRRPAATRSRSRGGFRRFVLMVVLPIAVLGGGFWWYMQGGRYISTDNANVGEQKVLITPEVSGRVVAISVIEGQRVKPGDPLVTVDPEPYKIAVAEAEAKLAGVRTDFAQLKSNFAGLDNQIAVADQMLALRRSEVERKTALAGTKVVSVSDVDTAQIALTTSLAQLTSLKQTRAGILAQLDGNPQLDISRYPPFMSATAAIERAQRDLDSTTLRAPIAGMATQVSSIQMGRWLAAGTAIFAVVGTDSVWVDANPKETDLEYVHIGQKATVSVDAFPGTTYDAYVAAISPGTGAQFSILPAQNASGNWVKVVQRVPLRLEFEPGQDMSRLVSGMSANISIDTGRQRTLKTVFGESLGGTLDIIAKASASELARIVTPEPSK
ncbi:MAG: HlyD family secretion protein [Ancalomicrobiaceae bacterium]|nr:HlyD family secretion protein [Ancalomicrobiaceae bacterium]